MANPQTENGYIKIANEILDRILLTELTGQELKVVLFVVRKTYGYNKHSDIISLSQFEKGCSVERSNLCKILKRLVVWRLLFKKENRYMFNKNHDEWVVVRKPLVVGRPPPGSGLQANRVVVYRPQGSGLQTTHKRQYTKNNITKDSARAREPDKKISKELIRKQKEEIAKKFNWPNQ